MTEVASQGPDTHALPICTAYLGVVTSSDLVAVPLRFTPRSAPQAKAQQAAFKAALARAAGEKVRARGPWGLLAARSGCFRACLVGLAAFADDCTSHGSDRIKRHQD